jgi:hypothetical protein
MELNAYYPLLCCHKNPTKFTESIHLKVGKLRHEEWKCKYIKKTTENTTMKQQKGKKKKPTICFKWEKKTNVQTFVTRSMRLTRNLEST